MRAARAGNLEKVRNFLNEEGDIHTCNAVSNNNALFPNELVNVTCAVEETPFRFLNLEYYYLKWLEVLMDYCTRWCP